MGNKMSQKPIILFTGTFTVNDIQALRDNSQKTVDIYQDQLNELFRVKHPDKQGDNDSLKAFLQQQPKGDLAGTWVFYPWSNSLLHIVSKDDLFELRTNRNKNLITTEEQNKLASMTIGVAGMSVGAGIAISAVYSGMSETIKIADFDSIDTSNLNRLRESLLAVGQKKVEVAAQHIYEIDPFVTVEEYSDGLSKENLAAFFESPKLDIVVDEIDDFKMKIQLRLAAKTRRIPLLMFTSLGDNILIDIERYDLDQDLEPFHGLLGDMLDDVLAKDEFTTQDIRQLSVKLVGAEYIPTRALESVAEMGRNLVGRPQLYSTIAVDGGVAAYIIRQIILGAPVQSGRFFIKFSELFSLNSNELIDSDERRVVFARLFDKNDDKKS